jgi:colanic acid biosynthesis glycosyl transferase WcaI
MRILFITFYFQPEPNFFAGLPFAKKLVELGHEVEVLTGFPNYPGGKVYDGYRIRPLQKETLEGIPVVRVPLYPSHDRSSIRRIISYTSFALSASVIGVPTIRLADVAYVSQGPPTIGLCAITARVIRGIPFVYDVKDLPPDCLVASGMFNNRLGIRLVDKWCKIVYRCASKIVAITPGIKRKLIERGVPEEKIEMIYEWCDDSHIANAEKSPQLARELGMEGHFNIVFAGNMGRLQSLGAVLDAAKIVAPGRPKIQFVLIGSGVEVGSLKKKAAGMGLKNVLFLPRRPVTEIGEILSLADVLLVHLKDEPYVRNAIPAKTHAYLAAGRPILVGVKGDAADLVAQARAGIACEPANPESIANAVKKFQAMSQDELDTMGKNGREFYQRELSLEIGVRKYERIFKSLIT